MSKKLTSKQVNVAKTRLKQIIREANRMLLIVEQSKVPKHNALEQYLVEYKQVISLEQAR